jgi:hypothetical protein
MTPWKYAIGRLYYSFQPSDQRMVGFKHLFGHFHWKER